MSDFRLKTMVRLVIAFVASILIVGLVYLIEPPEPAEAQAGHRICRGYETRWLFVKVNKGTRCDMLWVDAGDIIERNGGETFIVEGRDREIEYDLQDNGSKRITFRSAVNFETCEKFTDMVFPDYESDDICYELNSVTGADGESPDEIMDLSSGFCTGSFSHQSCYRPVEVELDSEYVITRGLLGLPPHTVDLGVCVSSGGCDYGYIQVKGQTVGTIVTLGYSAGFVGTISATYSQNNDEGFITIDSANFGDRAFIHFTGWKRDVVSQHMELEPAFTHYTENGCDARFDSFLVELASEGQAMTNTFEGLKTVYYGAPGCLIERKSTHSSMICNNKNFAEVLFNGDESSDNVERKCYLYTGPGSK